MHDKSLTLLTLLTWTTISSGCFDVADLVDARDGSVEIPDASLSEDDGSVEIPDDAGTFEPDAQAPAVVTCDATHPCGEGALCAPDGLCMQRCDDAGVCVIATSGRAIAQTATDGDTLYYAEAPSLDSLGNTRRDGVIRRLTASGSEVLASGRAAVNAIRVDEGWIYWHEANKLWRMSTSALGEPEVLYDTPCATFLPLSGGRLALQRAEGVFLGARDGSATLEKLSDAVTPPESDPDGQYKNCFALDEADGKLFHKRRRAEDGESELISIDLQTRVVTNHGMALGEPYFASVRSPHALYLLKSFGYYTGIGQHVIGGDVSEALVIARAPDACLFFSLQAQVRAPWIYYQGFVAPTYQGAKSVVVVARASFTDVGNVQQLVPSEYQTPNKGAVTAFSVANTAVYLTSSLNERGASMSLIQRIPIPSLP